MKIYQYWEYEALKYPPLALIGPGQALLGALTVVVWLCRWDTVSHLPAGAQRSGQHDGSGVDGLVETLLVYPSGELSDQDRGHPLEAQLLMNAQELDLHHVLLPARHIQPALRRLQENCCKCWQCHLNERSCVHFWGTHTSYTRIFAGTAAMKPTSLLLETTLMPQCHWADQFGGCKALRRKRMSLGAVAENRYVSCLSNSGSSRGPKEQTERWNKK